MHLSTVFKKLNHAFMLFLDSLHWILYTNIWGFFNFGFLIELFA